MRYFILFLTLLSSFLYSGELVLSSGHIVSEFEYNRVMKILEKTWFKTEGSISNNFQVSSDALKYLMLASSGKSRRTFLYHQSNTVAFLSDIGLYNNGLLESTRCIVKNCIIEQDGKYILQNGLKQRLSCKL